MGVAREYYVRETPGVLGRCTLGNRSVHPVIVLAVLSGHAVTRVVAAKVRVIFLVDSALLDGRSFVDDPGTAEVAVVVLPPCAAVVDSLDRFVF